ncbi:MAG: hypothetical protein FWE61_05910 [Micrococcales bacterium]|nr:hypothetical protein [Micrococcales bacterium]
MHEQLAQYVQTAAAHRDGVRLLHQLRAALGRAQWLPYPERRMLVGEIQRQQADVRRFEAQLNLEPTATSMIEALVDEALADVTHEGAPADPDKLVDAVVMVLARPGHPPLPSDYPVGVIHLPTVEPRLTRERVQNLVTESLSAKTSSS